MTEELRHHLPVIIVATLLGIVTCAFAYSQVLAHADALSYDSFSWAIILIPCAVMVIVSFAIAASAREIGRQLYLIVIAICLASGIVSLVVTSFWLGDAQLAQLLLANSPEGTQVVPPSNNPLVVIRDLAAYIVAPTVGCILGAWLGSRIHPMTSAR